MHAVLPSRHVRGRGAVVMYHAIDTPADAYTVTPAAFERQIELLATEYDIVPLRELPARIASGSSRRCIAITFDDAFSDFQRNAYPVLQRRGLPATVFVPTGLMGRSNEWDRPNPAIPRRPIMAAAEIQAIHREKLIEFGSHTVDHLSMASLDAAEMKRQAVESRAALESLLEAEVRSFAYPYGQLDNFSVESRSVLASAGYDLAVTTHWGTLDRGADSLELRRIHFADADELSAIRAKVDGRQNWRGLKERLAFTARRFVHI